MLSKYIVATALVIVGVIHLLPLSGAVGSARLATLYGIPFDEPNLAILMRHRAVLFGLLGLFFVYAAFRPSLQVLALFTGFASVISFLWLAYSTGQYNKQVATVLVADVIALVCLIIGAVAFFMRRITTE